MGICVLHVFFPPYVVLAGEPWLHSVLAAGGMFGPLLHAAAERAVSFLEEEPDLH